MGLGLTLKETEWGSWFYLQEAQREMGEASKRFHCDLESSHALCSWLRPKGSCPPCFPATQHRHPGESQSQGPSVSRGCSKEPGHHHIPRAQPLPWVETCPRWGAVAAIAMLMDGPRRQFFISKQYTCAFSLWGQVLTAVPAVLYLLSCCHLSPFPDKWTHFTAWVTHDCFRKPRLAQCSKGEK